ncbi:ATP-binding cassette domain-containing protein [Candidatus Neomicrothrix sp.]|jgi:ABC-2 type transport system ATP-binding protein|uniref:ATP-binding cassette domain-containing protein n=1 Tax=Candidatus Neomicrothrix subdominans TaxID=2954438 RepID=A0A936TF68_9ACTN|nr:ATP-binding cassette domain-containing protein [Candidatus Microthrix sp.]MBK9296265.1 ATP-binding cassette domain-containing protein [Candidatus Microthrix subdominans]MBK6439348.1 ATP-binding cassette domain-containing protein [Candidatus Microthrix sp.]MBK6967683.1 ATP-binding cassette domain-containing protein [Candidatus Microthrix sp.]MBK7164702.1 ATP-binding cassette domain-containing protein [Candidatus Microthrix sp.]MBP7596668.1 ATP-binding cassette domain-containing protein [Cand
MFDDARSSSTPAGGPRTPSPSKPAPAIEAHGITKRYGDVTALGGVDLSIPTGTVLGLLGPNGAGKTTMVRALTTTLIPDEGRATVLGHDVVTEADAVRKVIGLAGQYAAVDELLTGQENLEMIGRLAHLSRKVVARRATELLDQFDLADAGGRPAKTYSGGMRRRLDLAAALVHKPPVLFLDEPTTGLDPKSRSDLWEVIRQLVADGTTLLLTTQYLEEADLLADEIVVIDHGLAIARGTAAELKRQLGATVLEVNLVDSRAATAALAELQEVPGAEGSPEQDGTMVRLATADGPATAMAVLRSLDAAKIGVAGLALREPSLDDVFLSLTGHAAEETADTPQEATS